MMRAIKRRRPSPVQRVVQGLLRGLRRGLLVFLPLGVLPVVLACALAVWTVTTPAGTRLLLLTGARLIGVQVQTVSGTIWQGVQLGRVRWSSPELTLHAQDVALRVDWRSWLDALADDRVAAWRSASLGQRLAPLRVPELRVPQLRMGSVQVQWRDEQSGQARGVQNVMVENIRSALTLTTQGGVLTLHQATWQDVTAQMQAAFHWPDAQHALRVSVQAATAAQSRWLEQPVQASVQADVRLPAQAMQQTQQDSWWQGWEIDGLKADARLTQAQHTQTRQHTLRVQGRLGSDQSHLDVAADSADLSALWPHWRGRVQVQARLESLPDASNTTDMQGWRGQFHTLLLAADGVQFEAQTPLTATVQQARGSAQTVQWQLGAFSARLTVPDSAADDVSLVVQHRASTGSLNTSDNGKHLVAALHMQGAVQTPAALLPAALADVMAPASPFELSVQLQPEQDAVIANPLHQLPLHRLSLNATVKHKGLGQAALTGSAWLQRQAGLGWGLYQPDAFPADAAYSPLTWQARLDVPNLDWLNALAGDAVEVGGQLQAQLQGRLESGSGAAAQNWNVSGTASGQHIRLLRLDDGVRLLDGTLQARLENRRLILDSLRFPALPRVRPGHSRLAAWLQREGQDTPQVQEGYLSVGGQWPLDDSRGSGVNITLHRYPVVQRADRYAMMSGKLRLAWAGPASTPALTAGLVLMLTGDVLMDAGWVDVDALTRMPTLDSDVVVLRGSEPVQSAPQPPAVVLSAAVNVRLGPQVYLTGYGMDTALAGELALALQQDRLTAQGVLRPRGGTVSAYGQTLQLTDTSSVTFQSDIANPLLNIDAVRTGQSVQAGVRVAGTPARPRITLISLPEVNDREKLSWLLFGRGPDESGGDAALLLSAGSSFLLEGGEPFYRRFGVDELGMRSGSLGNVGSVLPVQSVVRGFDSGTSEIERKFVVASKHLSDSLSASVEQALSDTGTVGRLAWRLGRSVSAQLAVGTVNGLALIYHLVLDD